MDKSAPENEPKAPDNSSPEADASDNPPTTTNNEPKKIAAPKEPPKKMTKPVKQNASAPWPLIALVIVLFGLSATASVYLWQELNKQNALNSRALSANDKLSRQVAQLNTSLTERVKQLEETNKTQNQLITTLDKLALFNTKELNRLHASNRVDWLLAEAEYLLRLGNQRLNIERDVSGAEAIMMAADKVLMEIEDPSIYPIRQALAEEILALQSVAKQDLNGLYLQLQAIINSLDSLNTASFLKTDEPDKTPVSTPTEASDSYAEALWQTVWQDLQKALIIRRLDEPVAPLLAPEQSYFLKQNLQLMLEQAGLAVLNQDDETYQKNILKAQNWLDQYFVQKDTHVEAMKGTLASMKSATLAQTLPDISASLRLLKTRIEAMYRAHQLDRNSAIQDKLADDQENNQAPGTPSQSTQEQKAL